jgi:hypothetical protein
MDAWEETTPCRLCGEPTTYTGTARCDRCWELEGRIERDPELARQILEKLDTRDTETRIRDNIARLQPLLPKLNTLKEKWDADARAV